MRLALWGDTRKLNKDVKSSYGGRSLSKTNSETGRKPYWTGPDKKSIGKESRNRGRSQRGGRNEIHSNPGEQGARSREVKSAAIRK